jgi:hypothetical protein
LTLGDTTRLILQHDDRAYRAEIARDEAETRTSVISESWMELERYLAAVEFRAEDAPAGFSRIVAEGRGQLILTNIHYQANRLILRDPLFRHHINITP